MSAPKHRRPRLTLGQFVVGSLTGVAAILATVTTLFYRESRATILLASERLMAQASRRGVERIERHLAEAEELVDSFEVQVALERFRREDRGMIESILIGGLVGHPHVTEATLTYGRPVGTYDVTEGDHDVGDLRLAEDGRWQLSVSREDEEMPTVSLREVVQSDGRWLASVRRIPGGAPRIEPSEPRDPTLHATFSVPSRAEFRDLGLWSDLAFHEADAALPPMERRRVVSLQKALWAKNGEFLGVLRVALRSDRIDDLVQMQIDEKDTGGERHLVFICDRFGRLISRLGPSDRFELLDTDGKPDDDGDVRVIAAAPPPQLIAALDSPALRNVPDGGSTVARLDVAGVPYLMSVDSPLGTRTQGWRVGIVVPESHYLGDLKASALRVLVIATLLILAGMIGSVLLFRSLRRDFGSLIGALTRLGRFDFAASEVEVRVFRDVSMAADSLEQAKVALRALGKYVPIDLVRQLYDARREPVLGGEIRDVTLMFSDIEGFTSISERLSPNQLAVALGAYLDSATRAIHATGGIIDKYVGDGIMAMWNAPRTCEQHAARACEAALSCIDAEEVLFNDPAWEGRDRWRTRFGIHRAEVTVGHFGAPDRMSFTAMGDGVNLASRLESLNKQYGTRILLSATVEREARAAFLLRRLDRVAVKGKREGIEVYELLGRRSAASTMPPFVEPYERALAAYFERRFADVPAILAANTDDPPSRVLAARCRLYMQEPPPDDWMGVFVAHEK